jgi:hypothetical protein
MQIKMTEYLQGAGISAVSVKTGQTVAVLEPDGVYEVSDELAKFILDNRKGAEVASKKSVHYGAQKEPELRHDDEKYTAAEETPEPIMTTKTVEPKAKRGKK